MLGRSTISIEGGMGSSGQTPSWPSAAALTGFQVPFSHWQIRAGIHSACKQIVPGGMPIGGMPIGGRIGGGGSGAGAAGRGGGGGSAPGAGAAAAGAPMGAGRGAGGSGALRFRSAARCSAIARTCTTPHLVNIL